MMKNMAFLSVPLGAFLSTAPAEARDYLLSTAKTSLVVNAEQGRPAYVLYYGPRLNAGDVSSVANARLALWSDSYPAFGIYSNGEKALLVTHADGNMSVDLALQQARQYTVSDGELLELTLRDKVYPFQVKQYFKAYSGTDVISTWTELTNEERKPVVLSRFASAFVPLQRGQNWMTHFHGTWGAECEMEEECLTNGQKVITNKEGVRNTQTDNPSVMISVGSEKPTEEYGAVFGGVLAWSGNYTIKACATNTSLQLVAGINDEASQYKLPSKATFTTPEFAMTYSLEGKGGVSRAFHNWARRYKLAHGDQLRDVLLNSWEGVYFNVNQKGMDQMMADISAMGGELFVMDDGWFGRKYPRNDDHCGLGDWEVNTEKLPQGIDGLLASARSHNVKFGIWIEPEMVNTASELYEKHPDWVLGQDNRPLMKGRGGTQVVLDLSNPDVQDFVFGVVDGLLGKYPQIAYIKWDANCGVMNYGSHYLPKDEQSHLYIAYHQGLVNVLKRIRQKYPNVVMQACASGGGRVNYGLLPYFDEFWTSDNTDALQRVYMQWGTSAFYPSIAMASHVSADRNHQTGRQLPLKFRFDVAMSGRLGMEIQPSNMSQSDKEFATRAIAAYKSVRPVVQWGDLYRLRSPYEFRDVASLMYVDADKRQAVVFAYKLTHFMNQPEPIIRLTGVSEQKSYRITDLTPRDEARPSELNGKVISGRVLKQEGLRIPLGGEYASAALKLEAVD